MKRLLFILPLVFVLYGCRPIINLTSHEYVRVEVRDTIVFTKLVPTLIKVSVRDTSSHLENMYSYSDVSWSNGVLTHSLGNKATEVPVSVPITTIYKDKVIKVNELTKEQKKTIEDYTKIVKRYNDSIKDNDKLKEANKNKSETIWKLIGIIGILVLWIFRKPIIALLKL